MKCGEWLTEERLPYGGHICNCSIQVMNIMSIYCPICGGVLERYVK